MHPIKIAVAAALAAFAVPTFAADVVVSLYRAVPGQQVALLKWLADQDRAAAAAGVGPSQLYVHTSGASWDYMVIQPATTPEQDKAIDAASVKLGLPSGPMAGIEFRKYISEHTDTMTGGATTAADFLKSLK